MVIIVYCHITGFQRETSPFAMIVHTEERALTMILKLKFTQNEYKKGTVEKNVK